MTIDGAAGVLPGEGRNGRQEGQDDEAGRRWSKENCYSGYTSYASLNDLLRRDPALADLAKLLTRHAVEFARECAFKNKGECEEPASEGRGYSL